MHLKDFTKPKEKTFEVTEELILLKVDVKFFEQNG